MSSHPIGDEKACQPGLFTVARDQHGFGISELAKWNSGWFGIAAYGQHTIGWATATVVSRNVMRFDIQWLGWDLEASEDLRLRYNRQKRRLDFLANFGGPGDGISWSVESKTELSEADAAGCLAVSTSVGPGGTVRIGPARRHLA